MWLELLVVVLVELVVWMCGEEEGEGKTGGVDRGGAGGHNLFSPAVGSSSSELIFSIPPPPPAPSVVHLPPRAGGSGGRGGGASTSCGGRGGGMPSFGGGSGGGREEAAAAKVETERDFLTFTSPGLSTAVVCVLMEIPESGVQGVGNTGDPYPVTPPSTNDPPPPPAPPPATLRTEYWNSWKPAFGKGSPCTVGVMGVVAALVVWRGVS